MRKLTFVAALLVISFLLTSCGSSSGSEGDIIQQNFKQGVQEVQIRLLENAPPVKIYPGSNFKMVIDVDNQLAYDLQDVTLTLTGLNERYVQIAPNPLEGHYLDQMLGRSLTNPSGERKIVEFDGKAESLFLNAEQHMETFFIKLAYRSTLDFTDTVCLNTNVYSIYDAGCKVEPQKTYSGQGAPLAITKIEEIIFPGSAADIEFRINLQNKGRGNVGEVQLLSANLGNDPLQCDFRGSGLETNKIKFVENKKEHTLICRKERITAGRSYKNPLSLRLVYDYKLAQQNKLTLVR